MDQIRQKFGFNCCNLGKEVEGERLLVSNAVEFLINFYVVVSRMVLEHLNSFMSAICEKKNFYKVIVNSKPRELVFSDNLNT